MDINQLRQAIYDFKFHSRPSDGNQSNPCTVQDLNNVINGVSKVLTKFVDELENQE